MSAVVHMTLAWAAGVVAAFVTTAAAFGVREAIGSVGSSLPFLLIGFSLTVVFFYFPALLLLEKLIGRISPPIGAVTCLLLGALPVGLVQLVYGAGTFRVFSYENLFMFTLFGFSGAVFGWTWTLRAAHKVT